MGVTMGVTMGVHGSTIGAPLEYHRIPVSTMVTPMVTPMVETGVPWYSCVLPCTPMYSRSGSHGDSHGGDWGPHGTLKVLL